VSSLRVEAVDAQTAPDETLAAMHEIERACLAEMVPGEPPRDRAEAIAFFRHPPATLRDFHWLAQDEGTASLAVHGPAAAFLRLYVAPGARRRGVGSAILGEVLARCRALGVRRLHASHATPAGAAFARRAGAVDEQRDVRSLLDLRATRLPEPQVPAGWRLATWLGRVPDEHLAAYAHARAAMDDAPTPAGMELPEEGAERIRASEASLAQRQREMRLTVALRGDEVGAFTELRLSPGAEAAFTDDTGTAAEHRGLGLATAVKLESLRRLQADHPEVWAVTTNNAETNAAMLAINRKLGFVPTATFTQAALALA
jgi:GNAT superfamily N-acetyltransferase